MSASPSHQGASPRGRYLFQLSLGALGIVYGDIGTSPLYALRECFHGPHAMPATRDNVLGILSLIFWSLIVVISIKYLIFVMRADNRGEGGILALMSLVSPPRKAKLGRRWLLLAIGLFGAALLYGDGIITPAISVLSAMEGLSVVTPVFTPYVLPLTIVVLVGLFVLQSRGTAKVGQIFGPLTFVWFIVIAVLGVAQIVRVPEVLAAVGPGHALRFFSENGIHGFLALGAVFLVVTGGEALYADMGHFGRLPIRIAWFSVVLPALLANYFGQGALLLQDPTAAKNPFYLMAPSWALIPLVVLATLAASVASQAVISGAFSLTRQAVQLGYSPRLEIEHTSSREIGQIYIPAVNWLLMISTIGLVLAFGTSSSLAAAYGIAVTTTMVVTTMLLFVVARERWHWNLFAAGGLAGIFLVMDLAFFGANIVKIGDGGWFPLVVAALIFTAMATWRTGRQILNQRMRAQELPINSFLNDVSLRSPHRVKGTAIFMSRSTEGIPAALLHNLKHNKVLHERVVLLTIETDEVPHVDEADRARVEPLGAGFFRVLLRYGFIEDPDVPSALAALSSPGLQFDPMDTTYFLGRETLLATKNPGMALWRERLFAFMARNAGSAAAFFGLPPNRVVELGSQVEL